MKKIISFLLILSFLLPLIPIQVFASSDNGRLPDYHKEDVIEDDGTKYRKVYDDDGKEVELDRAINATADSVEEEDPLPETYDSRDYDRATRTKNQGRNGTCWAHAFCGAAESSLISQGYAEPASGSVDEINLSEAHLAYFRSENYDETSDNPALKDKFKRANSENFLTFGGNDYHSMATVARWSGFVDDAEYLSSIYPIKSSFSRHNVFSHKYDLDNAKIYYNDQRDEIKQAIMQSGAVTMSFYFDSNFLKIDYGLRAFYFYQNKYDYANHEVLAIGWDDNFSRFNYAAEGVPGGEYQRPPADGAWLIKNSWGDSADYIWISYYDTSLTDFAELKVSPSGKYDNNYQYDGTFCTGGMGFTDTVYGANVFTAKGTENVKGCGFYAFDAVDYNVTASVYTGLTDANNPASGTLSATKDMQISHEGYYTLDFDTETSLNEGDLFSIVLQYSSGSDSARLPYEDKTSWEYNYFAEKGQSFFSHDGENWTDITDEEDKGNIPIKAFTVDVYPDEISRIQIKQRPKRNYYCAEDMYGIDEEDLDISDLIVEAVLKDGSTCVIPNYKLQFSKMGKVFRDPEEPTITVSYRDFKTSFQIYIEYRTCTDYEMISPPNKLTYYTGDKLDLTGLKILMHFNDGRSDVIEGEWSARIRNYTLLSGDGTIQYNNDQNTSLSAAGKQTVRMIFFTDQNSTVKANFATVEFEINVIPLEITKLSLKYPDKSRNYYLGHKYTWEKVIVEYNSGATEEISDGYTVTGYNPTKAGTQTITIEYKGATLTYDIFFYGTDVVSVEPGGNYKTEYYQRKGYHLETFTSDNFDLLLICEDGQVRNSSRADVKFSGFNYYIPGRHKITVSYYGFETYYYIYNHNYYYDEKLEFDNVDLYLYGKEKGKTLDDYLLYKQTNAFFFSSDDEVTGSVINLMGRQGFYDTYVLKTYTLVIFGDVNCDGEYDGRDSVMLNCIVNGMLTKEQVGDAVWKAADCNHDGEINEADIELLNSAGVLTSDISQKSTETVFE